MDTVKQNSLIILKNSTAYPFTKCGTKICCCFCRRYFQDLRLFRLHMDSAHENVDERSLLALIRLETILLQRVDITVLRCKRCQRIFPTLDSLAEHLTSEHHFKIDMSQSLGLAPLKQDGDRSECFICLKKFIGLTQLFKHAGTHFTKHICEICGQQYETRRSVGEHVERTHKSVNLENPFQCRVCKKAFPTDKERKKHVDANKSCFNLKCNLCDERFRGWDQKQEHLVVAHGQTRLKYPCKECGEIFLKRILLYFHFKERHTQDFKCKFCEKTFPKRNSLDDHVRQHTGEKPFECTVCSKTFHGKIALREHEMIHDDSRKFPCLACSRLFPRKSKLKCHTDKSHPDYSKMFPDQNTKALKTKLIKKKKQSD